MLQNKMPSKDWLVFDDQKSIREPSKLVTLPLSPDDKLVMQKLIDFVHFSQDPIANKDLIIRPAVGLAAPQIGVNLQMYYIRIEEKNSETEEKIYKEYAMINPKIVGISPQMACLEEGEGCLSVKTDQEGLVPRSFRIMIEAYDYFLEKNVTLIARSYEAIVFQHEQDHLEGKLYYDRINKDNPWQKELDWIIL